MEAGPQFQVRPGAASAPPASAGVRSGLLFTRSGGGWEDCACKPTSRPGTAAGRGERGGTLPKRRDWFLRGKVIDAALAHVVQNKVEAAYARSDLFERRRILMDDWATYLGEERGQAVTLRR